ncbi:venom carboxylesterase-6-like [Photinus pyralis]|uniref:Carboxylic ester hydrolase n=3 Tax=Photinus pyralis TaxID=7054 RepID=A0A1Y1N163_PHOPY|nr:venom carboxylesterase-6-like [Photinus pyralis]XP_031353859.1 venom carboxylesterase-6-like [Photinus pyralis]
MNVCMEYYQLVSLHLFYHIALVFLILLYTKVDHQMLYVLLALNFLIAPGEAAKITTQYGTIEGVVFRTRSGKEVLAYMSMPYAEPPVGKLRFQPPVPVKRWPRTLNGSRIHGKCPQRAIYTSSVAKEGDEDCLYINVYTPLNVRESLPVMVYIHGGGYRTGCGSYNCFAPNVILEKDVVMVAFNYRLGPLGFLSTGDGVVPGNNGLKDQNLALRWVKDNIRDFGGDPSRITLFGQSAGAASVHLHILSAKSQGLFHSAILQSGSALTAWGFDRNQNVAYTKTVAKSLKCPTTDNRALVDCLMHKNPHQIVEADINLRKWSIDPTVTFKPTIEEDTNDGFITQPPSDLIRSGNFSKVPLIIGMNTEEGSMRTIGIYRDPFVTKYFNDHFEQVAPVSLGIENLYSNLGSVVKRIRDFYFKSSPINHHARLNVIDMYSDARFNSGIDETVRLHKKHADSEVFLYLFGHRGAGSYSEMQGEMSTNYGVNHCDELFYLFPYMETHLPFKKPDAFDNRISKVFTNLWTNFAATSKPTLTKDSVPVWEPVATDRLEFYFIGQSSHMGTNLLMKRLQFWRKLNKEFRKPDYD